MNIEKIDHSIKSITIHILLLLGAVSMIFPFWWMISTSLTENANTEISNPPRFVPWRVQNRMNYYREGTHLSVLNLKKGNSKVLILQDGKIKGDRMWRSRPLHPNEKIEFFVDFGGLTMLNDIKLFSKGGKDLRLYPDISISFAKKKAKEAWTEKLSWSEQSKSSSKDYTISKVFPHRIRARYVKISLSNGTNQTLPLLLSELEITEKLKASLNNYKNVLQVTKKDQARYGIIGRFGRYYLNSLLAAFLVTLSNLFLCSLAGFAFSKGNFPGRKPLFYALLATMMVPGQVTMIPVYKMMVQFGLLNNLLSIILPMMFSAYGVFLCTQFIEQLPTSLMEAARIDGCSEFRIFYQIVLPLSKPVLATLGIITFLSSWNSFLWPLIMLNQESSKTLPLGLADYRQQFTAEWGNMMAATAITVIPILIVFFLLQRHIIKGIALSGVKE